MKETWKEVFDYKGLYWVSNKGRVKSKRKVKKISTNKEGYSYVCFSKKGITKTFLVHRLVAMAFIPNPFNLPTVNHIDGNKLNNHVPNLEWCSYSNNNIHAFKTGLRKDNVFVYQYDENDNFMREYYSLSEANRITGICRKGIKRNLDKNKTYNNYLWKTF